MLTGHAAAANAGPAVTLSFLLGAVACAFAGLCYAEMSSTVPISGSAYTYAYATMGELIAWIIGWDLILEYAIGAGTVAIGWSAYVVSFAGDFGITIPAQYVNAPLAFDASTFEVWGPLLNGARLVLMPPEGDDVWEEIELHPRKNRTGDHWHIQVAGLPSIFRYGWRVDGPRAKGNRFDPRLVLLDPNATALADAHEVAVARPDEQRATVCDRAVAARGHRRSRSRHAATTCATPRSPSRPTVAGCSRIGERGCGAIRTARGSFPMASAIRICSSSRARIAVKRGREKPRSAASCWGGRARSAGSSHCPTAR